MRSTQWEAGRVEPGLGDGRLADHHAAIVHVIVHAAHDAAGVGLHQHAMAPARLDVEPDVVVVSVEQVPHGDVAEDDLAVGRGGAGRREGAAVRFLGASRSLLGGLAEPAALQAGRRGLEGVFQEVGLDVGVDRHQVEQIERPALPLGPGRGRAVGDSLHLLEIFGVEPAQEEGVGQQSQIAARRRRGPCGCDTGQFRRRTARSRAPSAGRAGSRVRRVPLRCATRSSRPAGSDNRAQTAARRPGRADRAPRSYSGRARPRGPAPIPWRQASNQ